MQLENRERMKQGIAFALASAVLFGMSTPLAKLLVGTVSPLIVAGLLYAGSGAGLMLVLLGRALFGRRRSAPVFPVRRDWPWFAAAIFFGGVNPARGTRFNG
jgi:drug/metabolite transporter (DMT)-like permease